MKKILLMMLFLLVSFSASANTTSVIVSPSLITHSVTFNPAFNLSWNVTADAAGPHVSTVGIFIATNNNKDAPLGSTINTTISIDCVVSLASFICSPKNETVTIPADVLTTAKEAGLTTIFYHRGFTDGFGSSNSMQINLMDSPVTPTMPVSNPQRTLHITRESLRFNDNTIVKVIKPNSRISAIAELNFTGTGLLDAFWEYASPASTRGRAIFVRLGSVRRYLGVGGRVILQSPPLPTDLTGQYVLRLQIRKTLSNPNGVEFTSNLPDGLPLLRYSVNNQGGSDVVYELPPIKTLFPAGNATLQTDTRFNWQAVKNAKAYQLELYLPDENKRPVINPSTNFNDRLIDDSVIKNKKPSTGLLIPATKTSLSLTTLSRETLKRSSIYYWRIIAIGVDGRILTTSALKQIRTP